jgi:hypothetical protein
VVVAEVPVALLNVKFWRVVEERARRVCVLKAEVEALTKLELRA